SAAAVRLEHTRFAEHIAASSLLRAGLSRRRDAYSSPAASAGSSAGDPGTADVFRAYVDLFLTGTGTPAIFTLTEKSVLLVVIGKQPTGLLADPAVGQHILGAQVTR